MILTDVAAPILLGQQCDNEWGQAITKWLAYFKVRLKYAKELKNTVVKE